MKDKRGDKIITKFATTLPKTYGYRVHIKRWLWNRRLWVYKS